MARSPSRSCIVSGWRCTVTGWLSAHASSGASIQSSRSGAAAASATGRPARSSAAQIATGLSQVGSSLVTATNFMGLCGTVAPLSPLYPTSRTWTASHDDKSRSFSLGGSYDFHKAQLDVHVTETRGTSRIGYTYNADALGFTPAQVALIGSGFPDITIQHTRVDANLIVPLSRRTTMRLFYLYEAERIRDWHYDGVAANPTPNTNQMTFLDSGPQDYHASVGGVFFTVRL